MSRIRLTETNTPATPPATKQEIFIGTDGHLKKIDDAGIVTDYDSGASYTNEDAQDAVGSILTDTSSVNLTYNDVANQITADVLPSGVDHDQLQNFVANEHIDHSAVNINAGTGLSGGGDITTSRTLSVNPAQVNHNLLQNYVANEHINHSSVNINTNSNSGLSGGGDITTNRSLALDINNLVSQTPFVRVPTTALLSYYDTTLAAHRKATKAQLLARNPDLLHNEWSDFIITTLGGLTALTAGTGSSAQAGTYGQDNAENCKGVVQYDTGTTSTGRAGLGTSTTNPMFLQTTDFYRLQFRAAAEILSVTGTEAYSWYPCAFTSATNVAGFGNTFAGFFYREDENGGRLQFIVFSGGVLQASVDTGFPLDIDYHIYEVTLDGATGTARGYIDGNLVATVSSGVFSGPTETFGFVSKTEKRTGTTQRNFDLDWFNFEYYRSNAR